MTNALSHQHTASYNAHNDATSLANNLNDTTNYGYATSTYNLTSITSPTGGDGRHRRRRQVAAVHYAPPANPTGPFSTADFRPTSVTDAQSKTTGLAYNSFGEATTISTASGQGGTLHRACQGDDTSTTPGPDCGGKKGQLCTATDGKDNATKYSYTGGNLTTMTPPAPLGAHTFTYDPAGRKTSEQDGRGNTAYTCYDANDRTVQISYTSAACGTVSGVHYTFDAVGNMTQRVSATGTTTVTYDAMNRALSKTDGSVVTSVTYDPADNITSFTDPAGTTNHRYDAANNLAALSEPGGSCPATPAFPNSSKCVGFSYDGADRRTVIKFPSANTNTVGYDTSGRQISIAAKNSAGTVLAGRNYSYNSDANADTALIRSTTDPVNGPAGTISYLSYDDVNRLTKAEKGPKTAGYASFVADATTTWTFDLNGNRTQQSITGAGAATTNYGYNAADQLCWSAATTGTGCTTPAGGTAFSYDGNGNQTSGSNSYTTFNQLASAATVGAQTYAGTTNVERAQAGSATFTNSLLGKISTVSNGQYNTQEYVRDNVGTLIAMQNTVSGATSDYYYTADNVGSIIAITNTTGGVAAAYTYDSYGNTTATTGGTFATTTNPWRYGQGYTAPTAPSNLAPATTTPPPAASPNPTPPDKKPTDTSTPGPTPPPTATPADSIGTIATACGIARVIYFGTPVRPYLKLWSKGLPVAVSLAPWPE